MPHGPGLFFTVMLCTGAWWSAPWRRRDHPGRYHPGGGADLGLVWMMFSEAGVSVDLVDVPIT
jgi:hypothetical protein